MCAQVKNPRVNVVSAWSSLWVSWNADLNRLLGNGNRESRSPKWDGNLCSETAGVHIASKPKQKYQLVADSIQKKVETNFSPSTH